MFENWTEYLSPLESFFGTLILGQKFRSVYTDSLFEEVRSTVDGRILRSQCVSGVGVAPKYAFGGGATTSSFGGLSLKSFFTMSEPGAMSLWRKTRGSSGCWLNFSRNDEIFPRASVEDSASAWAPLATSSDLGASPPATSLQCRRPSRT